MVSNNSAAYGAVLRVHSQRKGDVSVLFNNVTIANNSALRYGGVVSGYSHAHAMVVPFTFSGGRYYYDIDSYASLSRPLLRFGFNADPYLDPQSANIAPHGTGITGVLWVFFGLLLVLQSNKLERIVCMSPRKHDAQATHMHACWQPTTRTSRRGIRWNYLLIRTSLISGPFLPPAVATRAISTSERTLAKKLHPEVWRCCCKTAARTTSLLQTRRRCRAR